MLMLRMSKHRQHSEPVRLNIISTVSLLSPWQRGEVLFVESRYPSASQGNARGHAQIGRRTQADIRTRTPTSG